MLVMNAARKRYVAWFFPMMLTYVGAVLGVTWLFNTQPPPAPLSYLFALIPAIPIIGVIAIIGRYLAEETDEFVRMRQAISLLVAVGVTLSFCAVWGFLEIYADVPKIGLFNVVWMFFGAQLIGSAITSWWYR
jgi:cell division septal protein FtsQ